MSAAKTKSSGTVLDVQPSAAKRAKVKKTVSEDEKKPAIQYGQKGNLMADQFVVKEITDGIYMVLDELVDENNVAIIDLTSQQIEELERARDALSNAITVVKQKKA